MTETQEDEILEPPDDLGSSLEDIDIDYDYMYCTDPVWRNNGAVFIILKSLEEIIEKLDLMIDEGHVVSQKLAVQRAKFPSPLEDAALEVQDAESTDTWQENWEIYGHFWSLEHTLDCSTRTAILMAAIDLESGVNQFCFYNLGEHLAEAIEDYTLLSKMEVIHKVHGLPAFKGTHYYKAARGLLNWRNAFAHGKCTDMPPRPLKGNHIKRPANYPKSSEIVSEMVQQVRNYLVVYKHLIEMSKHPYIRHLNALWHVNAFLGDIEAFEFKDDFTLEKSYRRKNCSNDYIDYTVIRHSYR